MKRKIVPIALASLLLGCLFDFFFFNKTPGLSVLLYTALMIGATISLADLFKVRLPAAAYLLMPVILFFAAMVFVRASGMLMFFNIVLALYLMLLIVRLCIYPGRGLRSYTIRQYFEGLPWLPFQFFREANVELARTLNDPSSKVDRSAFKPVIRGIFIALPILIVFVLLLSSADLVFQKYVTSVFNFHINGSFVVQLILVLIVAAAFTGAFTLLFMRTTEIPKDAAGLRTNLGAIEMMIVLGSVVLLFLLFLIVQATYFFGGEHRVLTSGLTYAEYARHGFFELIAVAVISLLLIWFLQQSARLNSVRQRTTFICLSMALIAEVIIIMISAHMRLSLYEQAYGYTQLRLLAHMFIYWLAAAFILATVHIVRGGKEEQFAFRLFLSVLAFFIILNLVNPDALIARHNIARLQATGKIDTSSLAYLSEDATPVIATLLSSSAKNSSGQSVQGTIAEVLYKQQQEIICKYPHWQSANLARIHAKNLLSSKTDQLSSAKQRYSCIGEQLE